MSNRPEERDVYYIPPNFLTSGRLFGGAIKIRNAIEAGILVCITAYPILQLPISLTNRIIILCLITLPLGVLGVIGIEGDALSEFLLNFLKWLKNRRVLHRSDADAAVSVVPTKRQRKVHKPPAELGIQLKPEESCTKASRIRSEKKPGSRKIPVSKRSKKQINFTDDLIPVKDIRNGIIHMEDGRYIKILEVEPINFLLRSVREQKNIIHSFASWLKISPVRIQVKVMTIKA